MISNTHFYEYICVYTHIYVWTIITSCTYVSIYLYFIYDLGGYVYIYIETEE